MLTIAPRLWVHRKSPFVEVSLPQPAQTFWDDVCKAFRESAKSSQLYFLPVDNGGYCGRTDSGDEIKINTLGKWLFGTPGYAGHVMYEPITARVFRVHYPADAPAEVRELLSSVTGEMVKNHCRWWGNKNYL